MTEYRIWQRLMAEFLGTGLLVFIGVGSVPALAIAREDAAFTAAELGFISLAFGAIVAVSVYIFGYISGSHINPAVTVGLAAGGKFPWADVPGYITAQILGAVAGGFGVVAALGSPASDLGLGVAAYEGISGLQAFSAELIGTFVLVLVVFGAIHRRAVASMAGLVIGTTVFAVIITIGAATGAAINPARYTGPMIVQFFLGEGVPWEQLPVYVAAQLLGGVVAGLLFVVLSRTPSDAEEEV